jgi:hypothetical protein
MATILVAPEIADLRVVLQRSRNTRVRVPARLVAHATVRNSSKAVTFYVATSLRSIFYNDQSETLRLSTAAPPSPPRWDRVTLPTVVPALPGTDVPVRLMCAARINEITLAEDGEPTMRLVDVTAARRIAVTIGFATTAFRPTPPKRAIGLWQELKDWERIIEREFEARISEDTDPKG